MIPYDIDPSLYSADPDLLLDDGFSAPRRLAEERAPLLEGRVSLEEALAGKSHF